jgi:lipoprotein NlpI
MTKILELNLDDLLQNFISDSENADNNFKLAIYYDSIGQTASAISYYLRTAERTKFDEIKYQSLLRAAICFNIQGCRNFTVKGLLQHSLAIMPKRPEAYFLLSRFYEKEENYHDSYLIASIGENIAEKDLKPLELYVEYPGFYGLLFEKAVSSWWCGLCDESRKIFCRPTGKL